MPPSAGPGDRAALPRGRAQRDRLGQDRAGDEVGGERAERRAGEGAGDAEQGGDREQDRQADRLRPRSPQPRISAQTSSSRIAARAISRRSRRSAAQPLIGVSRNKGTNWTSPISPSWKAASRMSIVCAGDVIDLPADDDDHRHLRDRRGQARDPVGAEGGNAQRFGEETHALTVLSSLKSPGERPFCRDLGR